MARKKTVRRKKVAPKSVGLQAEATTGVRDESVQRLSEQVKKDGGAVLASYLEPFGGTPLLLVALPIDRVEPTPYQRSPSDAHVKRLMTAIEKIGRFLDPIVAVRTEDGYWTPNGNHRLQALRKLGARTIVALLVPDSQVSFKILALNTEKAHNLREKSLEAIRMARELARLSKDRESGYAFEFEEPLLLTLGVCYEQRPRLSGGAYQPILRRIDEFLDEPLARSLATRERRAQALLDLDNAVGEIVDKLKTRGFTSPYLRPFVVARINPIRFSKATEFDFDDVMAKMKRAADRFNVDRVKQEDVVRAGGAPEETE